MAWCSFAVFCCGLGVNIHSDHILRNLRKPGESTYKIPHGGLFNLISAPNYLGNFLSHIS
jgi:steroid 5-alpha reductase family enzyme